MSRPNTIIAIQTYVHDYHQEHGYGPLRQDIIQHFSNTEHKQKTVLAIRIMLSAGMLKLGAYRQGKRTIILQV